MNLYIFENCDECQTVQSLLKFLNVKYTPTVYKTEKALQTPEFAARSPFKKLPLLEVEPGVFLNGYHAIIKQVCRKSDEPSLLGSSPRDESVAEQYTHQLVLLDDLVKQNAAPAKVEGEDKKPATDDNKGKLERVNSILKIFDEKLKLDAFVVGTYVTYVDFLLHFSVRKLKATFGDKAVNDFVHVKRIVKFFTDSGL